MVITNGYFRMTSRLMDPFKALGRMGYLGGFINTFDGL